MFTLHAMPVKFVCLLVFFVFTTLWESRQLVVARGGVARTSHALHLLMSLVMLLMVPRQFWLPLHTTIGMPVLVGLMVLGVVWFAWRSLVAAPGHRAHPAACAGMFVAMVWHLAAMWVHMSHPMEMPGMGHGTGSSMDHGMNHSMESGPMKPMPTTSWMEQASKPGGELWWFALVGLVVMAGLLWWAVRDLLQARRPGHRASGLAGFAMNFGMFWMSTGLLAPILPFVRYLSF